MFKKGGSFFCMKNPRLAGLGRSEKVGKTLGRPTGAGGTGSSMYRRKNVRPGRELPEKEAREAPRRQNSGKQACKPAPLWKIPPGAFGRLEVTSGAPNAFGCDRCSRSGARSRATRALSTRPSLATLA